MFLFFGFMVVTYVSFSKSLNLAVATGFPSLMISMTIFGLKVLAWTMYCGWRMYFIWMGVSVFRSNVPFGALGVHDSSQYRVFSFSSYFVCWGSILNPFGTAFSIFVIIIWPLHSLPNISIIES